MLWVAAKTSPLDCNCPLFQDQQMPQGSMSATRLTQFPLVGLTAYPATRDHHKLNKEHSRQESANRFLHPTHINSNQMTAEV